METIVKSASQEVLISYQRPTVIIGEKINPTGRKVLSAQLKESCFDLPRVNNHSGQCPQTFCRYPYQTGFDRLYGDSNGMRYRLT